MPYLGKQPARVPVTAADIPDDSITAAKILDGVITAEDIGAGEVDTAELANDAVTEDKLADAINTAIAANTAKVTNATHTGDVTGSGALTIATDAVDIAMLSATGTASSSTFLRGDNSWVTPTDTNTTYSVQDGELSEINFTTADNSKLDGIASSANNYSHPTHNGDDFSVDTTALTGATVVSDIDINVSTDTSGHVTDANGSVSTRTLTLANLGYTGSTSANNYSHPTTAGNKHIPTSGSSGQFLKYDSSGTAVWATPSYTTLSDSVTSTSSL